MIKNSAILAGKTVLVAGASSGMGRAIALAAAMRGARVIALARRADVLATLQVEIAAKGGDVIPVVVDAADGVALAAQAGLLGSADVLVNSVGTNLIARAFDQLTSSSWRQMLEVNLTSAFNLTQAVLPAMRQRGNGLLIHIASTAARKPDKSGAAYQASKAGVLALAHAVTEEERINGIRVSVLLPGMTDTPLLDQRPQPISSEARALALQPQDIADTCIYLMTLPDRVHVAEILLQPTRA